MSAVVIPLLTRAEYPPIKFTPTALAALSRVLAMDTKSSGLLQAVPPTRAMGVTDIRLFTIGMPKSCSISRPVATSSFARAVILLYIFWFKASRLLSAQSKRLIPKVIVRTSSFSCSIMLLVSFTSYILIMVFRVPFLLFIRISP